MTPPYGEHSPDPSEDLLDRFVTDECTPAEVESVRRWIAADPSPPARQQKVARVRAVWETSRESTAAPFASWDVDAAWERAAARMGLSVEHQHGKRVLPLKAKEQVVRTWMHRLPVSAVRAASIFLIAGTIAAVWYAAAARSNVSDVQRVATVPAREYITGRGERATIDLVDGTRVILGPASKLLVPTDYGRSPGDTNSFTARSSAGPRTVSLEGEAHFAVEHDATRPFSVRVGSQVVRDIGTQFVVRAYESSRSVDVAVTAGVVLLAKSRLEEGDIGRVGESGVVRVTRGADLRPYTSWTTGRLVFDDTPLADAVPTLERWYDLDITVADSALYARRLYATLAEGDAAAKVLDLIALSLDVRIERVRRNVTIHSRR